MIGQHMLITDARARRGARRVIQAVALTGDHARRGSGGWLGGGAPAGARVRAAESRRVSDAVAGREPR